MRVLAVFAVFSLVSLKGCTDSASPERCDYAAIEPLSNVFIAISDIDSGEPRLRVSLLRLLTSPDPFIGCPVATAGYLSEGPAPHLYLSQEHAELRDLTAKMFVSINYNEEDFDENGLASTGCEKKFVRVHGTLSSSFDELVIEDIFKIDDTPIEQHTDGTMSIKAHCWISAETPNKALRQTLDPAIPFASAKGPSASSAAQLGR